MMKIKSKHRLLLLVAITAALVLLAGGAWAARKYQIRRTYARYRVDGLAAATAGHNDEAIELLTKYLGRNPFDIDAMIALAHARQAVPLPKGAHLVQAAQILRQVMRIDPKRTAEQRELLELYGKIGPLTAETIAVADEILKANPEDVDALRQRTISLTSTRKLQEALETAKKWAKVDPRNPESHLAVITLISATENGASAVKYTDSITAAAVGQATWQIVRALALLQAGQADDARLLLSQLASSKPTDKTLVFLTSDALERLGLVKDSIAMLRQAAASGNAEIRQRLLRRVWQVGDYSSFLELVGTPAATPEAKWAEETALKLMSLRRIQRQAEADVLEKELKAHQGDIVAAWVTALPELNGLQLDQTTATAMRDQCRVALILDPGNPFLAECLADAARVLGDDEAALKLFLDLANQNPSWLVPILRVTQLQMDRGHIEEAVDAASLGLARAPQNIRMASVLASVWEAAIGRKLRADDAELLAFVERIQQAMPGEELSMSVYLRCLAKAGKKDQATSVLGKQLAASEAPSNESTILNLAQISFQFKLGLEEKCIDRSERVFGRTPQSVFLRSFYMFSSDRSEEGLKWLRSNTPAPDQEQKNRQTWLLAEARYLDLIKSPEAVDAWTKLCDGYPKDLDIQQAMLLSPSVRQNRTLQKQAVDNLALISGKESNAWKLAYSRWVVMGPLSEEQAQDAAVKLNEILKSSPDLVEARFLLARCLEKLNNLPQAVEQLAIASKQNPESRTITLFLAQLLQENRDFVGAKAQLDRLASGNSQEPEERRRTAILLAQQGAASQAVDLLQPIEGSSRETDLLLAEVYFRTNQSDRALALAEKLLKSPDLVSVRMAADLYAAMGREADAEKALAQLDVLAGDPSEKQIIRANFQLERGNSGAALEILRKAVADDPSKPMIWRALASNLILQGETLEATSVAHEGLKKSPGDPVLSGIVKREALIRAASERGLLPLAIGLVQLPDDPALIDAATVLTGADMESPARSMASLSQLAERYPRSLPVQLVVADRLLLFLHAREASTLASRATQAFPYSAEPAKLAARCFVEIADWPQALAMAKVWRQRDAAHAAEADMAVAEILSQMRQYDASLTVLEPYIAAAIKKPDLSAAMICDYALKLYLAGKPDAAEAMLQPLFVSGGETLFAAWLQTVSTQLTREQAEPWIDRMQAKSNNSPAAIVALARAHGTLGKRFKDADHTSKAVALLHDLSERPELPAKQLLSVGMDLESFGAEQVAEQIYRKISPHDDAAAIARNNLAMILARRGDSAAALQLAQAAVQAAPGRTYVLDTLAFAQRKSKNFDAAVSTLRSAIRLEPWSADLRITLTEILIEALKIQEARKELAAIEEMFSAGGGIPVAFKQRLETLQKSLQSKSAV